MLCYDYLAQFIEKGLDYRTINLNRSAISAYHIPVAKTYLWDKLPLSAILCLKLLIEILQNQDIHLCGMLKSIDIFELVIPRKKQLKDRPLNL